MLPTAPLQIFSRCRARIAGALPPPFGAAVLPDMSLYGWSRSEPWDTLDVVAAVHFYATALDQGHLLDYLKEPHEVTLQPWPVFASLSSGLSRDAALSLDQVTVVSHVLGQPILVRAGDAALAASTKAGVFNRLGHAGALKSHTDVRIELCVVNLRLSAAIRSAVELRTAASEPVMEPSLGSTVCGSTVLA